MARALRLAERGLYTTTPNPRVGCVIARDGSVVGEGWHERAGKPHAEIDALRQAGSDARGATAYVTLEPCSHFGRTPPCATALIEAGVARVVAAMQDPNPRVAGAGLAALRAAGIETDLGVLEAEARELNIGFVSRMTRGRPWVRMKIAASLDGKTALHNGKSQWITGAAARRDGHRLRARACGVLTGFGTVRADAVKKNDVPLYIETDRRFHGALVARANNPLLTRMILRLRDHMRLYGIDSTEGRERQRASAGEHFRMIELGVAGDADGIATLIEKHILEWKPLFVAALTQMPSARV
jgi:pyrimidine deaminase RibD-like protein